jgi:hypothetical protein
MKNNIDTVFQSLTETKLKKLYYISFWFGIVYLVAALLSIPGWILLLHSQGISFSEFTYVISNNSLIANLNYFGGLINEILVGVIIIATSWFLIRNKMKATQITTTGVVGFSIFVFIIALHLLVAVILLIVFWPSFQNFLIIAIQIQYWTYWVRFILLVGSVLLLAGSYLKEKLNSSPRKYPQIVLVSLAILVIVLLYIVKFFN